MSETESCPEVNHINQIYKVKEVDLHDMTTLRARNQKLDFVIDKASPLTMIPTLPNGKNCIQPESALQAFKKSDGLPV